MIRKSKVFTSHAWPEHSGSMPVLLASADAERAHVGLSGKIVHSCWVLDYTYSAAGLYRAGRRGAPWEERKAAVGHLYPSGFAYWEDTRPVGCRIHSSFVTFRGGELAGLDERVRPPSGFARFLDSKGRLGDLLHEIARIGQLQGEAGFWQAQGVFLSVLGLLRQSEHVQGATFRIPGADQARSEDPLVAAVRTYLEHHLREPVSLRDLARHLNVSVSTLSHRYRALAGETPMKTRMRMALNVARSLLLIRTPLKQIADQTGFCDVYHLSKAFKRNEGVSPRAWLRTVAAGSAISSLKSEEVRPQGGRAEEKG